ncbi:hypothetical protein [Arthrobacter globiformis]|uniref:Uncharacterized protein n=1 Tax=Arthrobacter globiformis TaxID=1665 RepID=A0A328HGU4_ARTGO|nr:hypothetical protein [Arthrobacter globiformis]RAM37712.1 hypothetical protein DBZ45_08920 [Arthrobacter globiformis]
MFWGIDQKDWLQLWSGALGSLGGAVVGVFGTFFAAIIGGVVALVVVRLSNDYQERLARQQGELQGRLAAEQAEQQKAEAARIRENSLVADLIVATGDMLDALWEGREAVEAVRRRMAATVTVWKFETRNPDLFAVISAWPHYIHNKARYALDSPIQSDRIEAHGELRARVGKFATAMEAWPTADAAKRAEILADLKLPPGGVIILPADPLAKVNRP